MGREGEVTAQPSQTIGSGDCAVFPGGHVRKVPQAVEEYMDFDECLCFLVFVAVRPKKKIAPFM